MSRLLLPICLVLAGCAGNSSPPPAGEQGGARAGGAEMRVQPLAPRDSWDVYRTQGARIGYGHTTVRRSVEAGREILRTEQVVSLLINRGGEPVKQKIRGMSVETPEGQLLRFESEMLLGPAPIRRSGQVRGHELEVQTLASGSAAPQRISVPWLPEYRGPFAIDQTLAHQPMQPGQRRTLKSLTFGLDSVDLADVELTAKGVESTAVLGAARDLLRIETITRLAGGQKIDEGVIWCDRAGNVLKNASSGLEAYRVTKEEALENADVAELDLLSSMKVKTDRPLADPRRTKQVRYRVHLEGGDPARVFVAGPTQAVKSLDPHTAEITVYAVRPGRSDGNRDAPADPPTKDDLRPNNFIQSDDPLIVADAQKAAGDEKDPWRVAVALERFVNREVQKKDFSQAFASAAEVAKTREGDCTEHAVFLAALARARGIPARAAIGLVYLEGTQSFFYHMWTEVYVEKRWIPIDGTLALGGIAADHLKIAQSSLNGTAAYSAFLPVAQVAGRLKIEIVEVK
jgi:hypothetical protein